MRDKKAAKQKNDLLKKQMKEMGQLSAANTKTKNNSTKSVNKSTTGSINKGNKAENDASNTE